MTQIALLLQEKKKEFHGFIFAYGKLNVVCCLPEIYLKKKKWGCLDPEFKF